MCICDLPSQKNWVRNKSVCNLQLHFLHQDRVQKLKNAVGRIEMENTDIREKLRAAEQREALLDESKARLEAELSSSKKNSSEKHMEIEVRIWKTWWQEQE